MGNKETEVSGPITEHGLLRAIWGLICLVALYPLIALFAISAMVAGFCWGLIRDGFEAGMDDARLALRWWRDS